MIEFIIDHRFMIFALCTQEEGPLQDLLTPGRCRLPDVFFGPGMLVGSEVKNILNPTNYNMVLFA